MKILGYRRADFTAKDGTDVAGCNVFIGTEIDPKCGEGLDVEKFYMTDAKLERNGINLAELFEQDVRVYFNRHGKVDNIVLAD